MLIFFKIHFAACRPHAIAAKKKNQHFKKKFSKKKINFAACRSRAAAAGPAATRARATPTTAVPAAELPDRSYFYCVLPTPRPYSHAPRSADAPYAGMQCSIAEHKPNVER